MRLFMQGALIVVISTPEGIAYPRFHGISYANIRRQLPLNQTLFGLSYRLSAAFFGVLSPVQCS